jgi:peptidoglycan hydrolase CwlO-like protein
MTKDFCEDHGKVTTTQDNRNCKLVEMCAKLDKSVTFTTFSWVVGILIVVIGALAGVYAVAQDSKIAGTKETLHEAVDSLQKQNDKIYETMQDTNKIMTQMSVQIGIVEAKVDALEKKSRDD